MKQFTLSVLLAGTVTTALLLPVQSARAAQVVVGGVTYDVSALTLSYNSDPGRFNLVSKGGQMPWWGSSTLASEFAKAVGNRLGPLSSTPPEDEFGPLFAFQIAQNGPDVVDTWTQLIVPPADSQFNFQPLTSEDWLYAVATPVITPPSTAVPGPLPILGVSAGFMYSRRIRRRRQNSIHAD